MGAGTHAWSSEVTCAGKTITLAGAGKGATILDAGGARRFFTLNSGCTLVLRALSLRNGKTSGSGWDSYGGAILAKSGSTLSARDVEFKGNSASNAVRPRSAARVRTRSRRRRRSPARSHPPADSLATAHNSGRRGVRLRHRFLHELRLYFELRYCLGAFALRRPAMPPRRPRPCAPPPPSLTCPIPTHPPARNPLPPHRPRRTRLRLRATQGTVLFAHYQSTTTFASTLPVNSFSGNTGSNNYGNCYKYSSTIQDFTTFTGSCS
jgi:hypothetical protein